MKVNVDGIPGNLVMLLKGAVTVTFSYFLQLGHGQLEHVDTADDGWVAARGSTPHDDAKAVSVAEVLPKLVQVVPAAFGQQQKCDPVAENPLSPLMLGAAFVA